MCSYGKLITVVTVVLVLMTGCGPAGPTRTMPPEYFSPRRSVTISD
jgi:hypothetical protein